MWAQQGGGSAPCSSVLPPHPWALPAPSAPRPLVHLGPTGGAAAPSAPRLYPAACRPVVPPHGPQPCWDYVCLFICFCLNSDLFHVWFENFQTQKSKKLGRIWCPCPQPTVLGAGSSVYHIPPCPGPGRLASCWGGGSQGDAARACDEGGAGGLAWPGWAGAGPPYCAADLGAGWVGGGHRRLLGSLQEEPGSSRGRFWNACGRVQ